MKILLLIALTTSIFSGEYSAIPKKFENKIFLDEPKNKMFLFQPGVDLREIVDAVNQVGATPSSLIAILEALKKSGSLRAELVVI